MYYHTGSQSEPESNSSGVNVSSQSNKKTIEESYLHEHNDSSYVIIYT